MPRYHPTQVHRNLSALLEAGFLTRPPAVYSALTEHTPPTLPSRRVPTRPGDDETRVNSRHPRRRFRAPKPRPIVYPELDALRSAFYRDHPFEAHRPTSVIESTAALADRVRVLRLRDVRSDGSMSEHAQDRPPSDWRRLAQKTRVPSVDE